MHIADLPTPQVLVDRARLQANMDRMQALAATHGLALRPHAKTHKSPAIARWQLERGAAGICCAKLGEAEVFVASGIEDVRLPYPINPFNAPRLLALLDRARISIVVDHGEVANAWSEVMREAGETLDVLVKVDVGFHRCGIDPTAAGAAQFVARVASLPGLRLRGLLSHAGHAYGAASEAAIVAVARAEAATLNGLAGEARKAGAAVEEISVGATPTARFSAEEEGLTELRPGNYVYYDRMQVALGAAHPADCALTVLATVVSRPAPDRIVLDSGSKTLSSDLARGFADTPGYGWVLTDIESDVPDERLTIERLSEEHAVVRARDGGSPLRPGDRVRVLPNHACVVSNLVDAVQLVEGTKIVDTLPVAARGKIA